MREVDALRCSKRHRIAERRGAITAGTLPSLSNGIHHIDTWTGRYIYPKISVLQNSLRRQWEPRPKHVWLQKLGSITTPPRNRPSNAGKIKANTGKTVTWRTHSFQDMSWNCNLGQSPNQSVLILDFRLMSFSSLVNRFCYRLFGNQACQSFWWLEGDMQGFLDA